MSEIIASVTTLPKVTLAATLIFAASQARELGLPAPTATQILDRTGVSKSAAYEATARVPALLSALVKPKGRPKREAPEPAPALTKAILTFVMDHPGAVSGGAGHRRYSDEFRIFVLDLLHRYRDRPLHAIAADLDIPEGTLKDWLADGRAAVELHGKVTLTPSPAVAQCATILLEYSKWHGDFTAFCTHVQQHLRVPLGRTAIARILQADGVRIPNKRPGRSPDEDVLRGRFATFFPHAQWSGDGWLAPIEVDGETHVFNVELFVDTCTGAFTGVEVSRTEDSDGVLAAYKDAVLASGTRPIAILLDNKACNHTQDVKDGLGLAMDGQPTLLVPATLKRPQNKAHVEGAFGLLSPTLQGLRFSMGGTPEDTAMALLRAMVTVAGRAWNGRPREDRNHRSRLNLLEDRPTPEQIAEARRQLAEILQRQKQRRETLAARLDPAKRKIIADAFARLGLQDPNDRNLLGISRYPLDAVLEGVAIWEGKKRAGTLPDGVGAEYLLGIVRRVSEENETWEIASAFWDLRAQARDEAVAQLEGAKESIDHECNTKGHDDDTRLLAYVGRAMGAQGRSARFFWLQAAADLIRPEEDDEDDEKDDARQRYRLAARSIAATHTVPNKERMAASRFLAARALPVA